MPDDHHTSKTVNEIYFAAVEIESEDERDAFVEQACAGDPALLQEVNLLFASTDKADELFQAGTPPRVSAMEIANTLADIPEFFETARAFPPDDGEVGKQIGPFKLVKKIGEGGGGNVYLAEQVKPVRRQVALKIIKLGMDTRSVIARFEAERQALAMMEHPNIAHVLNAGETETGRPFFVMELVHGEKITTYCDENGLDIRQRLELFTSVCHAIQHAHLKGIIHRDIKPSNVLITIHDGIPMPKVIDFGIAKATSGDLLSDQTFHTSQEPFIGTPAYMSPEQADFANIDIDMRSDIFSLGVLLYELLSGVTPFDQKELTSAGLEAMRRMLCEHEQPHPSTRLGALAPEARAEIAKRRGTDPQHLIGLLNGDISWIVMKAMEKDRDRRYQTADALAEDVSRYLKLEPVVARPPSRLYRLQKLVRRNKGVFASIAAVSITLIAGLGASSVLLIKERAAHARAIVAEQKEARLRAEAVDRQRITQAAFLITQQKFNEADRLLGEISDIEPSTESEWVLRQLGEWYALNGNWAQAAKRYGMLLEVDIMDNSVAFTDDMLKAGPVLIEGGDQMGYNRLRQAAISRHGSTTDPIVAEQTLKICLLQPADEFVMKQLQPFADMASEATQGPINDLMTAWRCVSLALMAYRQDYTPTAIAWCEKCRSYAEPNPARNATAHIIQAMAHYRLDEKESAQAELRLGRAILEAEFLDGLSIGNTDTGWWFDSLFARILLREAEDFIENP